ncbi:hypothetical protein Pelo_10972 [Pelomyxa schiedti]|nr:hypothetical protein Pelo_10972 [Pelomyxa schiedti]
MRPIVLLLLAAVVVGAVGGMPSHNGEHGWGALGVVTAREWLGKVEIGMMPGQYASFSVTGGVTITLSDLMCAGVVLPDPVLSESSVGTDSFSASISVSGFGTNCTSAFSAHSRILHSTANGTLLLEVSNSSFNFEISLLMSYYDNVYLPVSANTTACGANFMVPHLIFYGNSTLVDDLNGMENETTVAIASALDSVLCSVITQLVNDNITQVLLAADALISQYANVVDPIISVPPVLAGSDDVSTVALVNAVAYFGTDFIGPVGLNNGFSAVTGGSGVINIDLTNTTEIAMLEIPNLGTISVGLESVTISGLDNWSQLDVFLPSDVYSLLSSIGSSLLSANITISTNFTTPAQGLGVIYDPLWLYLEWVAGFEASGTQIISILQLDMHTTTAYNFTNAQCLNTGCIISLVEWASTALSSINVTLSSLRAGVGAGSHGALEEDLQKAANCIASAFSSAISYSLPSLIHGISALPLVEAANNILSALGLNSSCEYIPDETPECEVVDIPEIAWCTAVSLILYAIFGIGVITVYCVNKRKSEHLHIQSEHSSQSQTSSLSAAKHPSSPNLPDYGENRQPCLFFCTHIPLWWRVVFPLLICLNVTFYLIFTVAHDAAVHISVITGTGRWVHFPPMYNDENSMWIDGGWAVSMLIILCSHFWNYLVLLLDIAAWMLPTKILSENRRGYLLYFLAFSSTWCFMDTYIEALMFVVMRYHFTTPVYDPSTFTITSPVAFDISMAPLYGHPTYILGCVATIILTLFALQGHQHVLAKRKPSNSLGVNGKVMPPVLMCQQISLSSRLRVALSAGMSFSLVVGTLLLAYGLFSELFSLEVTGAAAWLSTKSGVSEANLTAHFSVAGFVDSLYSGMSGAEDYKFSVRLLQWALWIFVVCLPFIAAVLMGILWVVPLKYVALDIFTFITEITFYSSATVVFLFTLLASLWELKPQVQAIVADPCSSFNSLLELYFGDLLNGDNTCFDVVPHYKVGCWVAFGFGSALYLVAGLGITSLAKLHYEKGPTKGRLIYS